MYLGVYLHDPRCICREAKTKTRRKNKEDVVLDALFWPVMPYSAVAAKLDSSRQPHVIQSYNVPEPQNDQYARHDQSVYSMWMHFVDFCVANSESVEMNATNSDLAPVYSAPDTPINAYTNLYRLPFFRALSAGMAAANMMKGSVSSSSLAESAASSNGSLSARSKMVSPSQPKLSGSPSPSGVSALFSPVQSQGVVKTTPFVPTLNFHAAADNSDDEEDEDELTAALMNFGNHHPQQKLSARGKGMSFDSADTTTNFGGVSSAPSRRSSTSVEDRDSFQSMLAHGINGKDSWDTSFSLSKPTTSRSNATASPDGTFSIWSTNNHGHDQSKGFVDRETPKLWSTVEVTDEEDDEQYEEENDFHYDCDVTADLAM